MKRLGVAASNDCRVPADRDRRTETVTERLAHEGVATDQPAFVAASATPPIAISMTTARSLPDATAAGWHVDRSTPRDGE